MIKQKQRSLLENKVRLWLVFTEGKHWTQRFLKNGFGHVYTITPQDGLWVVTNADMGVLRSYLYPQSYSLDLIAPKGKRVYYEADIVPFKVRRWFGPLNCVEYVKAAMGLSKPWVITPWQLYKEVTS